MLNEPEDGEKIFQWFSGPHGILLKLWLCHFKIILASPPSDIRQQAEHLLHEYELDDETLQKAQLEQHKIFQNFPTSADPSAPPPRLAMGTKPKVPSLQEQNDPDDDSSEALFDSKDNSTFLEDNDKPLAHTCIYKKILSTHSPSW